MSRRIYTEFLPESFDEVLDERNMSGLCLRYFGHEILSLFGTFSVFSRHCQENLCAIRVLDRVFDPLDSGH